MTVCSFLGPDDGQTYDAGLLQELRYVTDQIAKEHDEVDFWLDESAFRRSTRSCVTRNDYQFNNFCLIAAWETKANYPDKNISVTLAVTQKGRPEFIRKMHCMDGYFPAAVFDRIISPPEPDISDHKSMARWIIRQSAHIVRYVYPGLLGEENQYARLIEKSSASVIDLSSEVTADFIRESTGKLTKREQTVINGIYEKKTQKQLSESLKVSTSTVKEIIRKSCKKLRETAQHRRWQMEKEEAALYTHPMCGIFELPPASYDSLQAFDQMVQFLTQRMGVETFLVLSEYCGTGYMNILSRYGCELIVGITHYSDHLAMPIEDRKEAFRQLSPPCYTVLNFATLSDIPSVQIDRTIMMLMGTTDFCICNPHSEGVQRHLGKSRKLKILDITRRIELDGDDLDAVREAADREMVDRNIPVMSWLLHEGEWPCAAE